MNKKVLIVLGLAAVAVLFAAGCVAPTAPDTNTTTLNYSTAIVGDWKSNGVYNNTEGVEFYMTYHFNANNTGSLAAEGMNGAKLSGLEIYWGNVENNTYIIGYTTTSKGDYLYLSDDGRALINEFGETFNKQ